MNPTRVSIVELAGICGVSKTTVSAALGATGRVSETVRRRVRSEARRLGWRPDPHLSQLMGYLRQSRKSVPTCNLAWLNTAADARRWHDLPWFAGYLKGAKGRAEELGYGLDELWTRQAGTNARALTRQLRARGVAGVLLPLPEDEPVIKKLVREPFAWVVIDEAELELPFPRVQADRHGNLRLLLDEVIRLGYSRPGLALDPYVDRISAHNYSSAYLGWCRTMKIRPRMVDVARGREADAVAAFLKKETPDMLIGSDNRLVDWCKASGSSVPNDIAVAHLNLAGDVPGWAGIKQDHEKIGAAAVEQLVAAVTRREFGQVERRTLLVPGTWHRGKITSKTTR